MFSLLPIVLLGRPQTEKDILYRLLIPGISKEVEAGILVSKHLVSTNHTYTAPLGSGVNFECRVLNVGHFVRVWRWGDRIISVGNLMVRKGGRLFVSDEGDLKISDIGLEDAGEYVCEIDGEEVHYKLEVLGKQSESNLF